MPAPTSANCLRYWDLADHIQLNDAIALWCGVEPAELAKLNFETQCMSAKRAALVTALRDGRLEYEDLGIVTNQGKVFKGAPVDELLEKERLVISSSTRPACAGGSSNFPSRIVRPSCSTRPANRCCPMAVTRQK